MEEPDAIASDKVRSHAVVVSDGTQSDKQSFRHFGLRNSDCSKTIATNARSFQYDSVTRLPAFVRNIVCALAFGSVAALPASFDESDFKDAKRRAEKGDPEAELALGIMYATGEGVPQHYGEALKWFRLASDHGNPAAQFRLGAMHINGWGVAQNPMEGARWVRLAANRGLPAAQVYLGELFVTGTGVGRNAPEAMRWFRRAADQGDADSQRNLGNQYAEGQLVRADYVEAYKWFSLAAAQGDAEAAKARDTLVQGFSKTQIADGQRRAAAFVPRPEPGGAVLPKGSGTGFFVTPEGHFVTAYHVVESATRILVKTSNASFVAQVERFDKTNDLALLKILGAIPQTASTNRVAGRTNFLAGVATTSASHGSPLLKVAPNFRPLAVASSDPVKLGDPVSTIGFPNTRVQGVSPKFTRGEINSLTGFKDDSRRFQVSVQIQPGSSGGPLLDRQGNVIGVMVTTLRVMAQLVNTDTLPQNVNYALKSSYLIDLLKSVVSVKDSLKAPGANDGEATDWLSVVPESVALVQVF